MASLARCAWSALTDSITITPLVESSSSMVLWASRQLRQRQTAPWSSYQATSPSRGGFVLVSADWLEGQAFVDLVQVHGAGQLFVKTSNWF
ncbi:hypothetical protein [Lactobacillus delbrueckii]|uniref:hypothetical protein n=1 Tax=Lactobacillus delbrueckii TaxID=1584 RepID=UPI0021A3C7E9|nr:hypothetical protein [Lactobacillus delbrueckii]